MVNVIKRNGSIEIVKFDKITTRLRKLSNNLPIDVTIIAQKTISAICDNITTQELDHYSAKICAELGDYHHNLLGGRILVSNLQKNIQRIHNINNFSDYINILKNQWDEEYLNFVNNNSQYLNNLIDNNRDYIIDYFGFKTLEQSYFMKNNNQIVETPQYLWLRLASFIHFKDNDLEAIKETYDLVSQKYFIHATPTLFNSGQKTCQLCSCFLLGTEDSLTTNSKGEFGGIYKTLTDCAAISKWAGGIGVHISNIRAKQSLIKSTQGKTSSIIPMLKLYNDTGLYVNQGGRRNGSIAIYLEPWHDDIIEFLELKLNTGSEELRTRDLFLALWIPDLFMKQVEKNGEWYTMSPDECPGLTDVFSDEFENLYWKYVSEGKYRNKYEASKIWNKILTSQIETGNPYICYKDNVNKKSNQINVGVIKSSNLCVAPETHIFTSKGWFPIKDIENKDIEVWNGTEFSKTIVKKTGEKQKLIKIYFSNGEILECTPYHKFYVNNTIIEAKNLQPYMIIDKFEFCMLDDYNLNNNMEDFYTRFNNTNIGNLSTKSITKKIDVPINYTKYIKLKWLEYIFNTNGIFIEYNDHFEITMMINEYDFIISIKRLLNTMNINIDIIGSVACWKILFFKTELYKLLKLGVTIKELTIEQFTNIQYIKDIQVIQVIKIEDNDRYDDTYCFVETLKHKGVFNGILTGQCAEITEVSNEKYYAVCNLASIAVNTFLISEENNIYDWEKLHNVAKVITRNLNKIIDINYYPTPETELNNKENRPIGIGIQGFADLLYRLKIPYESDKAIQLNKQVMETIYHGAVEASIELAEKYGPYKNFYGSPMSKGIFQFDMWNDNPSMDWTILKEKIQKVGIRNSLLTALMPTASTSQILGNNESFEPMTSNIYSRKTLAGTFILINKYLIEDLKKINLWNIDMKNEIINNRGSIQNINTIPNDLKAIYKTVWEIKQKSVIDHAAARGPYVDQSQSMNLYMGQPAFNILTTALFYGWKKGLKTGCYYLRSLPAAQPQQFSQEVKRVKLEEEKLLCSRNNPEGCIMCSS